MIIPERPVPVNTTELHWNVLDGLSDLEKSIPALPADVERNTTRIDVLEEALANLANDDHTNIDNKIAALEKTVAELTHLKSLAAQIAALDNRIAAIEKINPKK